jgi:hypothetical protein
MTPYDPRFDAQSGDIDPRFQGGGDIIIDLLPAIVRLVAPAITIIASATVIDLQPARVNLSVPDISIDPGITIIELEPAILILLSPAITVLPGNVEIDLLPAMLHLIANGLTPFIGNLIDLEPARLNTTVPEISIQLGISYIDLLPAILNTRAPDIVVVPGGVIIDLEPARLLVVGGGKIRATSSPRAIKITESRFELPLKIWEQEFASCL